MTFEELDRRFPNGLDDVKISDVAIDYNNRTATLHLNLRGNLPNSPERDVFSPAILRAREIYYFSIEPPDSDHLFPRRSMITVDGHPEDPHDFPLFGQLKPQLPATAFCCRFYVHDWNSFIHIAALNAEFSWGDGD
jgi:hypothetical protein